MKIAIEIDGKRYETETDYGFVTLDDFAPLMRKAKILRADCELIAADAEDRQMLDH